MPSFCFHVDKVEPSLSTATPPFSISEIVPFLFTPSTLPPPPPVLALVTRRECAKSHFTSYCLQCQASRKTELKE